MSELAARECIPCRGGVPPLELEPAKALLKQLDDEWQLVDGHHIERQYELDDFAQALELTNRIGALAEEQGHHPDISLGWGRLNVRIWTHKIDGLTESDFILAAKIDEIVKSSGEND